MANFIRQNTKTLVMHRSTNFVLLGLIFLALLSYVYFARLTVYTLTALEKTKIQMQSLSINVSEMESKRLSMENGINEEKALQMGFVEVSNPIFIVKGSKNTALSLKTD